MVDYVARLGGAALGGRLRRLSATIDADASRIYAMLGIHFEQRWLGVIDRLDLVGPSSVSDLAKTLGITHVSVSQTRRSLELAGLIKAEQDGGDARRRLLALSPAGEALVAELRPLWNTLDDIGRELDQEAGGVTQALAKLEAALARQSLSKRVSAKLPNLQPCLSAAEKTSPIPGQSDVLGEQVS